MLIGDQNITRESMPAMQAWMANPDHLRQSIQDVLQMKLGGGMMMPQQQDMGMMGTMAERSNQWNGGQQ